MRVQVPLTTGIESLFGTRDENIRLIESGLNVRTRITSDAIEIEGEQENVFAQSGLSMISPPWFAKGRRCQTGS